MNQHELGIYGESMAERFLKNQGYEIIAKNVRFKKWEVDIVALDDQELVIVEVKTRQTAEIGEPWRAVTRSISIVHNTYRTDIEHIKHAFYPAL